MVVDKNGWERFKGEPVTAFRDRLHATIQLPPGMTGELAWRGATRPLTSGRQELDLP